MRKRKNLKKYGSKNAQADSLIKITNNLILKEVVKLKKIRLYIKSEVVKFKI